MDKYIVEFLIIMCLISATKTLRDVQVSVTPAVRRGESTILKCIYDLEGDSLYAVKWYKGRREFYRYMPNSNPAIKIFIVNGINVLRSASNESQVSLSHVQPTATGKYSCEVSADAPSYHTELATKDLEVIDVPEHQPTVHGIEPRYKFGDSLRANCTSKSSKLAANLTWAINDLPANPLYVRKYRTFKDHKTELETSMVGLQFRINSQHFLENKMKIRCTSQIHNVYFQETEKVIEQEKTDQIYDESTIHNMMHNTPYDAYNYNEDDFSEKVDSNLIPVKGDESSITGEAAHPTVSCYNHYIMCILIMIFCAFNQIFLSV